MHDNSSQLTAETRLFKHYISYIYQKVHLRSVLKLFISETAKELPRTKTINTKHYWTLGSYSLNNLNDI